jgi:hypothetical protein
MPPTCWADIHNMSATDKNVCHLGGGTNRHKSQHCQPRFPEWPFYFQLFVFLAAIFQLLVLVYLCKQTIDIPGIINQMICTSSMTKRATKDNRLTSVASLHSLEYSKLNRSRAEDNVDGGTSPSSYRKRIESQASCPINNICTLS